MRDWHPCSRVSARGDIGRALSFRPRNSNRCMWCNYHNKKHTLQLSKMPHYLHSTVRQFCFIADYFCLSCYSSSRIVFFISVDVQYMWNSYIWIYPLHAWIFRAFRYYCVSFSLDNVQKCNDHVKLGFLSCLFPVTRFLLQCGLLIKSRLSHFNSSYCDGRLQQVAWTLPWYDLHFSLSLHYNQNPA